MNHYVFQVSDQSNYSTHRTAAETFDQLVRQHSVWGFGKNTPNRKAIQPGDKVLFYLTGADNQTFVGSATLKTGSYVDATGESKDWFLDPETLRIDLQDVAIFPQPKPRHQFKSLEWQPRQGGSSTISERDYLLILGLKPDTTIKEEIAEESMDIVLEEYLENMIIQNWEKINFGEKLTIFEDENGNLGKQYYTKEVGYIDILAKDSKGNFVVVELKVGRKNDEVVGQILRYMGWVRKNLAGGKENVRGLIIVGEQDTKLDYALSEISDKVEVKKYNVSLTLNKYE